MAARTEDDYPPGHPARFDYNPDSPEAQEWMRVNYHPRGQRDFPVDHPKAYDTPGNANHVVWEPGVDPNHPELQAFTGRTPEQVAAHSRAMAALSATANESPVVKPMQAPQPPDAAPETAPSGQPGDNIWAAR